MVKAHVKKRHAYDVREINVGLFTWACLQTSRTCNTIHSVSVTAVDLEVGETVGHICPLET